MKPYLLSICIATYNRADLLVETLNSIVAQLDAYDDVEVVVVDGNSTDHTETVVMKLQSSCPRLNYIKLKEKGGVDKDFDIAVQSSSGLYCWLFTDDDLVKAGAVGKVRAAISNGTDLIVVNAEICDYGFHRVLKKSALPIEKDQEYDFSTSGRESFFKVSATYITFIDAIVIKKALWTEFPRNNFYGSRFIHVGVISTLSDSTTALVLAEPLIKIRLGNAEWSNISFKVWAQLWPNLIWSFSNLSVDCKKSICRFEPWKSATFLMWSRALGSYSNQEYKNQVSPKPNSVYKITALMISFLPQWVPRIIYFVYAIIRQDSLMIYHLRDGEKSKNSWFSTD
jgi:glycosyltransferase involved in cell wall biosynthesis